MGSCWFPARSGPRKQEISANLQILKEGMAKDMVEQIAKLNQASFQDMIRNLKTPSLKKSLAQLETLIKANQENQEELLNKINERLAVF